MTDPLAEIEQAIATHADGLKHELARLRSLLHLATKEDLNELKELLMAVNQQIAEFATRQNAFNQRQGAAVDGLVASVSGVTDDVQKLKELVEKLQNTPGAITSEDQIILDQIDAQADATATKLEGVAAALKALDEATPPTPPANPA